MSGAMAQVTPKKTGTKGVGVGLKPKKAAVGGGGLLQLWRTVSSLQASDVWLSNMGKGVSSRCFLSLPSSSCVFSVWRYHGNTLAL